MFLLPLVVVLIIAVPLDVLAQQPTVLQYQPLVGIPGVSNAAQNFGDYINQLYFLSISIAALLAVIKIILAGVKWMLTDIVTSKADAKKDIWGALLGLLLIVSTFIILQTINPNLTRLRIFESQPIIRPVAAPAPPPQQPRGNPIPLGQRPRAEACARGGGTWEVNAGGGRCITPTQPPT